MKRLILSFMGLLCLVASSFAQMQIKEIDAVYKDKADGRIIPNKEFQSFKGNYTFHRLIKNKGGKDTILISPPTTATLAAEVKRKRDFEAQVGRPAKAFSATDIHGNTYSLAELKNKVVVLNFWFVACTPCIKEMPQLNQLVDQYGKREDIVFLAFSTDNEALLGKFLAQREFKYEIFAQSKSIAETYLVGAYPTSFVIDKNSIVTYAHTGLGDNTVNDIHNAIKKALD